METNRDGRGVGVAPRVPVVRVQMSNEPWETQPHMTRILWLLVIEGKLEWRPSLTDSTVQTRDITKRPTPGGLPYGYPGARQGIDGRWYGP